MLTVYTGSFVIHLSHTYVSSLGIFSCESSWVPSLSTVEKKRGKSAKKCLTNDSVNGSLCTDSPRVSIISIIFSFDHKKRPQENHYFVTEPVASECCWYLFINMTNYEMTFLKSIRFVCITQKCLMRTTTMTGMMTNEGINGPSRANVVNFGQIHY